MTALASEINSNEMAEFTFEYNFPEGENNVKIVDRLNSDLRASTAIVKIYKDGEIDNEWNYYISNGTVTITSAGNPEGNYQFYIAAKVGDVYDGCVITNKATVSYNDVVKIIKCESVTVTNVSDIYIDDDVDDNIMVDDTVDDDMFVDYIEEDVVEEDEDIIEEVVISKPTYVPQLPTIDSSFGGLDVDYEFGIDGPQEDFNGVEDDLDSAFGVDIEEIEDDLIEEIVAPEEDIIDNIDTIDIIDNINNIEPTESENTIAANDNQVHYLAATGDITYTISYWLCGLGFIALFVLILIEVQKK
jgi:hypothetical protein